MLSVAGLEYLNKACFATVDFASSRKWAPGWGECRHAKDAVFGSRVSSPLRIRPTVLECLVTCATVHKLEVC